MEEIEAVQKIVGNVEKECAGKDVVLATTEMMKRSERIAEKLKGLKGKIEALEEGARSLQSEAERQSRREAR